MAKFLETLIVLLLFLSPVAVLIFYEDGVGEGAIGLIIGVIVLILFFWQAIRYGSISTKERIKELERNQEKSRRA